MTVTQPVTLVRRRHAELHPLRVSAVDRLTDDAVAITFDVPPELAPVYDFVQGQHVSLRCAAVGDDVRRSYSICTPAGSGVLRVAVKLLEGGAFSSWAHRALRPGEVIEVMTPTGSFHTDLDPAARRRYVAVAAGSGITPLMSILATTLAVEPQSEVTLVYGNRTTSAIMFLEELQDLKDRYLDRFSMVHVLSREPQDVELYNGRIDAARMRRLAEALLDADSVDEWYVCGPAPMIDAVRAALGELGVAAGRIHSELFFADPRTEPRTRDGAAGPRREGTSRVTAMLDGRSTTLDVPCDGPSILDSVLAVRADAPFACKGGVCGTCRARVISGEVTMDRSHALEASEVAAGMVLTCQSHPVSDEVTLDYDA